MIFTKESEFKVIAIEKGFIKPNCLKLWKERKEVYLGFLDGVINVYLFNGAMEQLSMVASFQMHEEPIHQIYVIPNLKFAISSGFDSCLKVWKPPQTWERKFVVTNSLIKGVDPQENLSTIKEEYESINESAALIHRITAFENPYNNSKLKEAVETFEDLLDQD